MLLFQGMSLSGADDPESRRKLEHTCQTTYPNLSQHYSVHCDTTGPIATACKNGTVSALIVEFFIIILILISICENM